MFRNQQWLGISILATGLFIFLWKIGAISGKMWPFLIFLVGIALYTLVRFAWLPAIAMVPAGILTMNGILFMIICWTDWEMFGLLWPLILIGIGLGLYGYYIYDPYPSREVYQKALLFSGLGIAMLAFMLFLYISVYMIAVILILMGLGFVLGKFRS